MAKMPAIHYFQLTLQFMSASLALPHLSKWGESYTPYLLLTTRAAIFSLTGMLTFYADAEPGK